MPPPIGRTPRPQTGPASPFLQQFAELPARSKQRISHVPTDVKQMLLRSGWSEEEAERKAQDIGRRLAGAPGSWWDIATMIVPPLVASLIPGGRAAGRTISRIGSQILTNVAGTGAIRAAQEAVTPTGKGSLAAGLTGGMSGVIPGVVQGGMSALIGPSRATVQTQNAIKRLQATLSPEVGELLDIRAPSALFSRQTVTGMTQVANEALDRMEARLGAGLRGVNFRIPIPGGTGRTPQMIPVPFEEVRTQIKALRDIGDMTYGNPEARQTARRALRDAAQLEESLVSQMRRQGFNALADDYAETLATYAKDRTAIRTVKAIQRAQALPGGANPEDFRDLAHMVESLKSPNVRDAARGVAAAVFAAKGQPGLAAHYAPFSGRGFIRPGGVQESVGIFQQPGSRVLGGAAAVGTSAGLSGRLPWDPPPPESR